MNVVDSSGWLEFMADGPGAGIFAPVIELRDEVIVPTVCLYEVYKRVLQQRDQTRALAAVAFMRHGSMVVALDAAVAQGAAQLALETGLPMADAVILATARTHSATLWTMDADFEGFERVEYRRRPKA